MSFFGTTMLILIVAVVISVILAVVLFIIHKKLKKKVVIKEQIEQKESTIKNKLEELKNSNMIPKSTLDSLGGLAKDFLKETFKIEKNLDYSELAEFFGEKKKKNIVLFCNEMLAALYSGEKIERKKIDILISDLEDIIYEQYPSIAKIEIKPIKIKKQITKKSPILKIEPIKIKEKIPMRIEEKPFEFPKEEEKSALPLIIIPQKERIMRQINSLDEEQIRDAYNELQKEFTQAYEVAEMTRNRKILDELEKFRESIKRRVNDYIKYHKIIEFAQEISKGARLISSLGISAN